MSYWVLAQRRNRRPIVDGPHKSYDTATDWIVEHIEDQERRDRAEVVELPTSNPAVATRMLKHRYSDKVGLDEATRNAYHPKKEEVSV